MPKTANLDLFNPADLPEWNAWTQALAPALDKYGMVNSPADVAPHRAALEQTFGPVFQAMTAAYGRAQTRLTAQSLSRIPGIEADPDPTGPDPMDLLFAIKDPLDDLIRRALSTGLVRPLVTQMVAGTPPDLPENGKDIWACVPPNELVNTVLTAVLADGPYYRLNHDVGATLDWLAHDPVNAPFWDGWARDSKTLRRKLARDDDHLAHTVGEMLVKTSRRMAWLPAVRTIVQRLDEVKEWSGRADGWGFTGYTAASALKHSFVSVNSPTHDPMFEALPRLFWKGVRSEVLSTSVLGRWINTNLLREVLADPGGPQAQDMVIKAWLTLDKKQIQMLEQTMPGCSQQHMPALAEVRRLPGYPHRATLDTVQDALKAPRGRWALAVFRRAGAPVSPDDLNGDAFEDWQKDHPGATVQVLMALHAQMEATALKKAMQDPSNDLPKPEKARPVRRL